MGRRLREGKAVLEAMTELAGEETVLETISGRLLDGADSRQISAEFGIVPSALWQWLRADPPRMRMYRAAQRDRADMLANDALLDAENATVDGVQVAKLKVDTKLKIAGKWDRETYGDGPQQGGQSGGITVIVDRDSALSVTAPDGNVLTVSPA